MGAAGARNTGLLTSTAPCVAFLDADDRWEPTFLASQLAYLRRRPACSLVYADARISGGHGAGRTDLHGDDPVARRSHRRIAARAALQCADVDGGRQARLPETGRSVQPGDPARPRLRSLGADRLRRRPIEYQRHVLAERRVRRSGLSGDPVHELDRARAIYLHLAQTLPFPAAERDALRARLMWIMDRREIERARASLANGDLEAAQRHLVAIARPDHKIRVLRAAIRVAPELVRKVAVASGRLRRVEPSSGAALGGTAA